MHFQRLHKHQTLLIEQEDQDYNSTSSPPPTLVPPQLSHNHPSQHHSTHSMNLLMNAAANAAAVNSSASSSPNMDQKSNLMVNTNNSEHHFNPKSMGFPDINHLAQQQHSLSSSCSNSSSSSKSSSHGLNQKAQLEAELAGFNGGYQPNPQMNAALAALSQYHQGPGMAPIFNPSAIAAMAQLQGNGNPMQSLVNNLLSNLMSKDQSAGN